MANLPNEEGLNPQSDVTLPLIEDLPFDSDINFEEAGLKFLEEYGDLFASVEVEDIGLETLIQNAGEQVVVDNNQADPPAVNSLSVEPEPLFAQTNELEANDNSLGWLEEDEEANDYQDWLMQSGETLDSGLDLSWSEEPIVSQSEEEAVEEPIVDESEEEVWEEEPIVSEEFEQDQDVDDLINELETLLQIEEESEPQGFIEPSTIDELETLLQYDQDQGDVSRLEVEPEANEIDELETLLQTDEEHNPEDSPPPNFWQDSDPAVDELITLLQNEENALEPVEADGMIDWKEDEDQSYSSELASMWDTPEEGGIEGLLEGVEEQTIGLEGQYEWEETNQPMGDAQNSSEEEYEYYSQQSEIEYESDPNYEDEDEDSSIDEIISAFQTNDEGVAEKNNDGGEYAYEDQEEYEESYENDVENEEVSTMNNNYEQQLDWDASYNEYQESEEDDYDEWQQGLSSNDFEVDLDDEDSAIDEIVTTFQFGQDNPSTQVLLDEEADAMVTKWQQTEKEEDYSLSDTGMIDWEKLASGSPTPSEKSRTDLESFTSGNDPMETAIRAKNVLEKSNSSLKESINFKMEEEDISLPPLPPIRQTRTEISPSPSISMPNFADEFYEEERYQPRSSSSQSSGRRKDGIVLEDDTDLPYRSQLQSKSKKSFTDVEDDDWEDLLEDIPPVPEEMFGVSEQTAARYAHSTAPSQFTDSFQLGDTQPANLNLANSLPSHGVSQTAPTFPETPPTAVRVQQFFENNGRVILQISKTIGFVVIPISILWGFFSFPAVNKRVTITGLRLGIWRDVRGKNLRGIVLKGKNLSGVNFSGADLSGSDLREVNLRGAKLNGARLEKTNLKGAKLNLANFTDADLKGANLTNTEVSKTIFRGANLSGTKLSGRKWAPNNAPITDNKTRCPNGSIGPCRL